MIISATAVMYEKKHLFCWLFDNDVIQIQSNLKYSKYVSNDATSDTESTKFHRDTQYIDLLVSQCMVKIY